MAKERSLAYPLSLLAVLLAFTVVLLGAYTRLVDAGLGCPDWPGCYGFISVPQDAHEIAQAEAAFPQAPVEAEKAWPEMIHRYFAGSLGLLIAVLAFLGIKHRKEHTQPLVLSVALVAIVVFQAALGMWTVTLGLLPIIVMGHLLGGFTTLTLLVLLFLAIRHGNPEMQWTSLQRFALLALVVLFVQITLGGWTSTNYAAIICTDFPTCQGALVPPLDFSGAFTIQTEGVTNYLGGHLGNDARVTIHWMHRVGALITALVLLTLVTRLFLNGWKKSAIILLLVLITQISLGISNVLFSLPLPVAVAHNGVAALLLVTLASIVYHLGLPDGRTPK